MSVLLGLEPSQKFGIGGWWSKDNLEFHFGPNLGLELEAWTKLNNTLKVHMNTSDKL